MLKESKLIKHQVYFFQSKFGVHWIMPISEQSWDGDRVDVLTSVSLNDLVKLPKYDNLRDYLVERKQPVGIYRESQSVWDVPKDKWGMELYKHYSIKISSLVNDIIIPIDVVENEYPDLIIKVKNGEDKFCNGITKEKEVQYRREIKLKSLLYENIDR